jgi:PilZ domain
MDSSASNKNSKTAAPFGDTAAKRRSQRVQISMPILVRGNTGIHPFEEETKTAVVNANGCSFLINAAVTQGQQISVLNPKTAEELPCRVAFVGQGEGGRSEVGVEFSEPSPLFWRISFPPEDWDPAGRKLPTSSSKPPGGRDRIPFARE